MKEISKKKIRSTVEVALGRVLKNLRILNPSKKTGNILRKVSKKFSEQLKIEVKRQGKKGASKSKSSRKATVSSAKGKKF